MNSQRISFVSKMNVILKATSDDESPTPGYLYKEINDISFESAGYCESLVEFLVDRLKSNSCHVKFKVLKLMKHLLENGSRELQLRLRKHSDSIKECIKFGGPPHPMHGNIPYLMVRKISKELCEVLYNMEQPSAWPQTDTGTPEKPLQSKYGGLGPAAAGGSAQGFGNTPPQPKTLGETILDGIEKLGAKMSEKPSDRQAALLAKLDLSSSTINYKPPVVILGNDESMLSTSAPLESHISSSKSLQKQVKKHQPGRAGGGWGDDDDDGEGNNENNNDNESRESCLETMSFSDQDNRVEGDNGVWKEELELVTDALKQGSTGKDNVFLASSTITEFLNKCSTLNCEKVVEILARKLISQDAGVILRSLQLLEGIVYNRDELVSIDNLTLMCKKNLAFSYLNSQSKRETSLPCEVSEEINLSLYKQHKISTDSEQDQLQVWTFVQGKSAKVILILQQLSSHKDILLPSHFKNYLISNSLELRQNLVQF